MNGVMKAEFKRGLLDRKFMVLLLITVAITIFLGFFRISSFSYTYLNTDGEIERYQGKEAIEKYNEDGKHNDEYLTTEGLKSDIGLYRELYNKYQGEKIIEFEIELSKMRYFLFLPYAFEPKKDAARYRLDYENLTLEEVDSFYENRKKHQINLFTEKTNDNPTVVNKLLEMEERVEKPFKINFTKQIFLDDEINDLFLIFMYVSITCCFLTAPVFSESYHTGEDEVFRATRYGKVQLGKIKIFVSILKGTTIFVINTFLYLSIVLTAYGVGLLNSSVQVTLFPILPYPLTLGEMIVLILLSGISCWFYLMSFVLFVSAKTKAVLSAIAIPIFCIVLNFSMSNWMKVKSSIFDMILKLIPNAGNSVYADLFIDYKFIEIGKMAIWSPYLVIILGVFLGILFLFLSNKSYEKHQ